jgi:hypothetical protein
MVFVPEDSTIVARHEVPAVWTFEEGHSGHKSLRETFSRCHPQKASRDGLPTVSKASRLNSLIPRELRGEHPLCGALPDARLLAQKPNYHQITFRRPAFNPPSVTAVTSVRCSARCASFSPRKPN